MYLIWHILLIYNLCYVLSYSFEDMDISKKEMQYYIETKSTYQNLDQSGDNLFMPYTFDSGVGNRESLVINDVSLDKSFSFGKDVIDWTGITVKGIQYLIGKKEHSVTLLLVKLKQNADGKFNSFFFNETYMNFEGTIGPIVLTEHINYNNKLKEGFALVTESTIENFQNIHRLKLTKKGMVLYDTWSNPTRGEIINLIWIKDELNEYLIIVTREDNGYTTIDISEYIFQDDKTRLMCKDKHRVNYQVSSVSVIVIGENLYLILVDPVQEKVWLYEYSLNFYEASFKELLHFYSPGVTASTAFVQSGLNYFLINGFEPNIYLLNYGGTLIPQLKECGKVEEWLVLNVANYREDVVLLARDQDNISMLTWKGSIIGFVVSPQPPCFIVDSQMNKLSRIGEGTECLTLCSWKSGAVVSLGHMPSLFLSCNSTSDGSESHLVGGLYHFNVSLHPVPGPAQNILEMFSRAQKLEDRMSGLSDEFEEAGLIQDIDLSIIRQGLQEEWVRPWDNVEQCLENVGQQLNQLSSYMELRRQNDVKISLSLQLGVLEGTVSGLVGNQTVNASFKAKQSWQAEDTSEKALIVNSKVILDDSQQFNVKVKANLGSFEVVEIEPVEELKFRSNQGIGISPEIQGPSHQHSTNYNSQSLHRKAADHIFN